jgi:hypothetical protein
MMIKALACIFVFSYLINLALYLCFWWPYWIIIFDAAPHWQWSIMMFPSLILFTSREHRGIAACFSCMGKYGARICCSFRTSSLSTAKLCRWYVEIIVVIFHSSYKNSSPICMSDLISRFLVSLVMHCATPCILPELF